MKAIGQRVAGCHGRELITAWMKDGVDLDEVVVSIGGTWHWL
ncbi:hypothetical protein [Qingshengfaniella alkalisoli]|nr:hypothetical protein [Qingshengfaniella alkalisoli]